MDMVERVARSLAAANGVIWGGPRGEDDPDFLLPKLMYMRLARAALDAVWEDLSEFMEFDEHGVLERIGRAAGHFDEKETPAG